MKHPPIFAFDFSINKPAMTCLIDNKMSIYIWPLSLKSKNRMALEDCGVYVMSRNLDSIHDKEYTGSELIVEQVTRAKNLAKMISDTIIDVLKENNISDYSNVIIVNEGFAFGAKGDAILDLSGYKYVLMMELIENGFRNFYTYSPITLKSTAGCAKKGETGKDKMIERMSEQDGKLHPFIDILKTMPDALKNKTNYYTCVDDIADSFWCLKTLIVKEKIDCILS